MLASGTAFHLHTLPSDLSKYMPEIASGRTPDHMISKTRDKSTDTPVPTCIEGCWSMGPVHEVDSFHLGEGFNISLLQCPGTPLKLPYGIQNIITTTRYL